MKGFYKAVPFIATLAPLLFFLYQLRAGEETFIEVFIQAYGYLAVGILAFFSGFLLTLSPPAELWIVYYLDAGLSYALVIVTITIFVTLGDTVSILFASWVRDMVKRKRSDMMRKLSSLQEKAKSLPLVVLFLYSSFVPVSNELLVYPLVLLGYRLRWLLVLVFLGNLVFSVTMTQIILTVL